MLSCGWIMFFLVGLAAAQPKNKTVLVFGDSWGSLGPSWHEIQATFDRHNVSATVKSAARGGTTACQWAADKGMSMALEAAKLFPEEEDGPDFVWYTLGGNDLVNKKYENCSFSAKTYEENKICMNDISHDIDMCTNLILEEYWKKYPKSKVVQCWYDIVCELGDSCVKTSEARIPFCKSNVTCMNEASVYFQKIQIDVRQQKYPQPQYTGLNILGAAQKSGGIPGAEVGHPVMNESSPCGDFTSCVHPKYGSKSATAIGDAFWDLFFSKYV